MDLLFKHLGINTPPDLKQGQTFNHGIRQFSLESNYGLLQEGSPTSLLSSIETMKNNDTTSLSNLDNQFKQLLSEYTGLLNTVNREIVQEQQKYGPMSDYLGKRLKTNSHDTYINEYGYARDIPLSDVVDSSCPKSSDIFKSSCQGLSDAYGVSYSAPNKCPEGTWKYNGTPYSSKHPDYYGVKGGKVKWTKETPCCNADICKPIGTPDPDKTAQTEKTRGNAPTDTTTFGCAPDYAKEWWKHHSCKTKPSSSKHPGCEIASVNTAIFKKGADMKPGEPCHLAGKNIRNSKTNQVAWVDLTGVKHAYPNSKMRDSLIGCNTKVTVTLDDAKFSNVPTGSPMTNDGICLNISVNEQDYTKLLKMKIKSCSEKYIVFYSISKDSETETEIRTKKSSIHAFLKNLKKERKNFDQNKHLIKTMQYQSEDSHVRYVSNKYHMIAWGLLVAGVGGFTVHQLSTRVSL